MLERYGVEESIAGMNQHSAFMDSLYYNAAPDEDLDTAIRSAQLSYRVEENGKVTFLLKNTEALEKSYIQSAVVEITEPSGKIKTFDHSFKQSKTDPDVYWCYAETKYREEDLEDLAVKAYFEIKGHSRCQMASLSG